MRRRCGRGWSPHHPRFARVVLAGSLAISAGAVGLPTVAQQANAAPPIFVEYLKPQAGPRGAVTILGDSVMLGSAYETDGYGPSLATMLVARGWGPVLTKAGVGFQAGANVAHNPGANLSRFVLDQRAAGWDSPVFMVNIGPNDILGCRGSRACAENDILGLVDTIGTGHEIWFSLITMTRQSDADAWNAALADVAAKRQFVTLWDWPTARQANGIVSASDNIHLPSASAYRTRSTLMADDVTARLGVSQSVDGSDSIPSLIPLNAPSEYRPLSLTRVYDSRSVGSRVNAGGVVTIDLSGLLPSSASAVSINLTAVVAAAAGFLTAYPCHASAPPTSNVNFLAGENRANHVVVGLDPGKRLCVLASAATDIVVDLQGAFVESGGLRLSPLAPSRVADTRITGRQNPLAIDAPAGAKAVVVNVTAVNAVAAGFVVVYPCGTPVPETSNLKVVTGSPAAGSVYAEAGAAGTVCIYSSVSMDVVVDLNGSFAIDGFLRFQAAEPRRMLDTRVGLGGWRGQLGVGQQAAITVAPAGAQAVTGNITMVGPAMNGFETAFRCDHVAPATSSVNAAARLVAANSLTTGTSAAGLSATSLCIRSSVASHVVFDTTGWWVP